MPSSGRASRRASDHVRIASTDKAFSDEIVLRALDADAMCGLWAG
jgi:hypothetical protein